MKQSNFAMPRLRLKNFNILFNAIGNAGIIALFKLTHWWVKFREKILVPRKDSLMDSPEAYASKSSVFQCFETHLYLKPSVRQIQKSSSNASTWRGRRSTRRAHLSETNRIPGVLAPQASIDSSCHHDRRSARRHGLILKSPSRDNVLSASTRTIKPVL